MSGEFLNSDGKQIMAFDAAYRQSNNASRIPGDVITVQQLLDAAAVNLDAPSEAIAVNSGEITRSAGIVITVVIDYKNRQSEHAELKYKYIPSKVRNQEFKILQNVPQSDGTILNLNRHGVKVTFVQTGSIGTFDFLTLLKNLVAAFALLSVARLVVEKSMLWILPMRHVYKEYKFESTEDFSDLREGKAPSPIKTSPDKYYKEDKGKKDGPRPVPVENV
ncbi:cytochrome c oxidase subunit 1 [Rhizophlyctis rosea]|uniref:Cytochrome c oxidase subunit 1 n=1 Tax=Rhizophlyctis rosea TaxID=64517 RepID=A0AAD5SJC1_9FUNG|nr:cytochrome c oxidase subunit 1 [Rhizophlyctis rosea]